MAAGNRALSNRIQMCAVAVICLAVPVLQAQWLNYKAPGLPRTADGKTLAEARRHLGYHRLQARKP